MSEAMNWEPMTKESVFEYGESYLLYTVFDEKLVGEYCRDGHFAEGPFTHDTNSITHFARITNPNEEKP